MLNLVNMYACVCVGMSQEAGRLYPGAAPQPKGASTGTNHTANGTQMAAEHKGPRAMGDGSQIGAWHGQSDTKENVASALNPAYSHDKVCSVAAVVVALQ